jgi:hypothetical protein
MDMVTVAGSFDAAIRSNMGLSPWACCRSGAANQNWVSTCERLLMELTQSRMVKMILPGNFIIGKVRYIKI